MRVQALEVGCKVLLIDEDTAATNFMIRDRRMQLLVQHTHTYTPRQARPYTHTQVQANKEPITPFIARVRELYDKHGVSSILVRRAVAAPPSHMVGQHCHSLRRV